MHDLGIVVEVGGPETGVQEAAEGEHQKSPPPGTHTAAGGANTPGALEHVRSYKVTGKYISTALIRRFGLNRTLGSFQAFYTSFWEFLKVSGIDHLHEKTQVLSL